MILFINVCLTSKGSPVSQNPRGLYPLEDKLKIFQYTLASYAAIPLWTKIVCNVRLIDEYASRWDEFSEYVHMIFADFDFELNNWRCERQKDWQVALSHLVAQGDPLTFYVGNHDHPFMDYNLDVIQQANDLLLSDKQLQTCLRYSHLSELSHWWRLYAEKRHFIRKDGFKCLESYNAGIDIIPTKMFFDWWCKFDIGDTFCPRMDWPGVPAALQTSMIYYPPRVLCEHFDAYEHIGISVNSVPPLKIPQGFFENDIKILYGGNEPKDGYFYINPTIKKHSCIDACGTDAYWVLDDIPLFWRSRISKYELSPHIDPNLYLENRNRAVAKSLLPIRLVQANLELGPTFKFALR